jgi:hypothetical protein
VETLLEERESVFINDVGLGTRGDGGGMGMDSTWCHPSLVVYGDQPRAESAPAAGESSGGSSTPPVGWLAPCRIFRGGLRILSCFRVAVLLMEAVLLAVSIGGGRTVSGFSKNSSSLSCW